jgi:hypothetical protein
MDVTPAGMLIDERLVALLKAESPIEVTLAGIVIDERLVALANTEFPIEVRVLVPSKLTEPRAVVPIKADSPI